MGGTLGTAFENWYNSRDAVDAEDLRKIRADGCKPLSRAMSEATSIALLIDTENVQSDQFDVGSLTDYLTERGRLVVRRAYGGHPQLAPFHRQYSKYCIEMASQPANNSGKNGADIRLVVDAMELALTRPHINTFAIVSGDSDFLPLVGKLQELGKRVIVIANQSKASKRLQQLCDEYVPASQFQPSQPGRKSQDADAGSQSTQSKVAKGTHQLAPSKQPSSIAPELLYKVFWAQRLSKASELQRGLNRPLSLSALVASFRALFPQACPTQYGFPSKGRWKRLLLAMQDRGLLTMNLSENRSTWSIEFTPQFVQLASSHPKPARFDEAVASRVSRFQQIPASTAPHRSVGPRLTVFNEPSVGEQKQPTLFDTGELQETAASDREQEFD